MLLPSGTFPLSPQDRTSARRGSAKPCPARRAEHPQAWTALFGLLRYLLLAYHTTSMQRPEASRQRRCHSAALSIVRRDAVANTVRQRIEFGRAAAATADQRGPGLAESHSEGTAAVLRAGGVASGTSELSDSPSGSASPSSGSVGASNKAASPIVARRST